MHRCDFTYDTFGDNVEAKFEAFCEQRADWACGNVLSAANPEA